MRAIQRTEPPRDITSDLAGYADTVLEEAQSLCWLHLHREIPEAAVLFRVRAYNSAGNRINCSSRGVFARRLTERMPLLPVEESGRLNDADLCENFILRVYAWHEWHTAVLPTLSHRG